MSQHVTETGGTGPSHRRVEIGVALFMGLLGVLAVVGALQVGVGWGDEGPRAGFFPFYIGIIVIISSIINLAGVLTDKREDRLFAEWPQILQVVSVIIPTTIYVLLIPTLGIYVASALLIGVFMKWFGGYSWLFSIAIAIAVPIGIFVMFEMWFLVPLPKGPLENYLGY